MRVAHSIGITLIGLILGLSCGNSSSPGFGHGGSAADPGDGIGGGGGGDDTALDTGDTGDTGDTADTADTADTGAPVIEGTGYSTGNTAYDLDASTQTGSAWSLHQQYGQIVVLVVGNMYDASMVEIMGYLDGVEDDYDGLIAAAFVGLNENEIVADQDDASRLAVEYGVSVVMYDPALTTWQQWVQGSQLRVYLIDREMQIVWTNTGSTSEVQLRDHIDDIE